MPSAEDNLLETFEKPITQQPKNQNKAEILDDVDEGACCFVYIRICLVKTCKDVMRCSEAD